MFVFFVCICCLMCWFASVLICLFVCLFGCLFVCLFACLLVCLFVRSFVIFSFANRSVKFVRLFFVRLVVKLLNCLSA